MSQRLKQHCRQLRQLIKEIFFEESGSDTDIDTDEDTDDFSMFTSSGDRDSAYSDTIIPAHDKLTGGEIKRFMTDPVVGKRFNIGYDSQTMKKKQKDDDTGEVEGGVNSDDPDAVKGSYLFIVNPAR